MRYKSIGIDTISYELPDQSVSSDELEEMLAPAYAELGLGRGLISHLTGVDRRRWWPDGIGLEEPAIRAGKSALATTGIAGVDLDLLVYCGVCRELLEPAMACSIANALGVRSHAMVFDVANACLGVLNGIVAIANAIELGQAEIGMVVTNESSRPTTEAIVSELNSNPDIELFWKRFAVLTFGSGAAAVIVSRKDIDRGTRLLGGMAGADLEHHSLSRFAYRRRHLNQFDLHFDLDGMETLRRGLALGKKTWGRFLPELQWDLQDVDRIVCHQVGREHQVQSLQQTGLDPGSDYNTYATLGNMGSASVPITAAIAAEAGFLESGDRLGLLGIGSGLSCIMLGLVW